MQITRALCLLPILGLAACATAPQVTNAGLTGAPADATITQQQDVSQPAETISSAAAMTDVSAFIDPTAYSQLSDKSKAEAAGAQFNALQFGRVGAPRNWAGDKGQSGVVTVGPYVRVNLIDCRNFTHTVTIGSQNFVKKGTACRDATGGWTVSATTAG